MPPSQIAYQKQILYYNEDYWVVSLISECKGSSMPFIVVEGQKNDQSIFIEVYSLQIDSKNRKISQVNIDKYKNYDDYKKNYSLEEGSNSFRSPAILVQQMIDSIKNDKEKINKGKTINLSIKKNRVNYMEWYYDKLEVTGSNLEGGKKCSIL